MSCCSSSHRLPAIRKGRGIVAQVETERKRGRMSERNERKAKEDRDLRWASNFLCLWRLCRDASCRRARCCRRNAGTCAKRNAGGVLHEAWQFYWDFLTAKAVGVPWEVGLLAEDGAAPADRSVLRLVRSVKDVFTMMRVAGTSARLRGLDCHGGGGL